MTTLPIPVDDDTATAFREAPDATRDQILQVAADYVRSALRSREERLASFRKVADELGATAQANGWNDELDAALLRGDFDHDD